MGDIRVNGFSGMNTMHSAFYSGKGIVQPRIVLNADVDMSGSIVKRDGLQSIVDIPNAHSLWACDKCMLCAANGKLYDISDGNAIEISSISGNSSEQLSYEFADERVYISNKFWNGIYVPENKTVLQWGVPIPEQPILLVGEGGLPNGTYNVVLTNITDSGELSGSSQISEITLESDNSGIQILNRQSGALVWATDSNNYHFMFIGDADVINEIPTSEPLPTFLCSPPPCFSLLHYAFGRMWGAVDDMLYYSEPYQYGLYRLSSNFFKFDSEITVIASVSSGIFIGMKDKTVFLMGTEPEQMSQLNAGAGSIKGTLAYANNLPELGDILGTPEKGFVDVPVWRTTEGIVAGNITGKLYNLTKHKIKIGLPDSGASLYRQKDGNFQFLTSSKLSTGSSAIGGIDSKMASIFKNGGFESGEIPISQDLSNIGMTEDVTCEIWRNGVLI